MEIQTAIEVLWKIKTSIKAKISIVAKEVLEHWNKKATVQCT